MQHPPRGLAIDWVRVFIVAAILAAALIANVVYKFKFPRCLTPSRFMGLAVWVVILVTAPLRQPDWKVMPETFKGTIFLLSLVTVLRR